MKSFVAVLLLPFAISYSVRFLYVLSLLAETWPFFQFFIYGFLVYGLIHLVIFHRHFAFWATLEHELTHILFALFMFRPVVGLQVTNFSGGSTWLGKDANFLIRLAPYFFPTFPIIILLLKPVIVAEYFHYYSSVLGFFVGYHIISSIKESHPWQPDIKTEGHFFSYVFIFLMHSIFLSCIILVLLDGWTSFWLYLQDGFWVAIEYFENLIERVLPFVKFYWYQLQS